MERTILIASILTSSLIWAWVAIRIMRSGSAAPTAGVVETVPHHAALLGLAWIVISMVGAASVLLRLSEPTGVTLESVKSTVAISGGVAFVLAFMYAIANDTKQENQLSASRAVGVGLLGWIASLMPVLMIQFGIKQLQPSDGPSHELLRFLQENKSPTEVMWVAAAAVVTAPLLEELVYRVILQGSLRAKVSRNLAIIISAVIFAVAHGWPNMLGLLPLALILGYLYDRTNNYLTVVTTHAAFNMSMLLMSTLPTATWFAIIM